MADANNPGQFGNRDDTQAAASAGGQASSGSFGDSNSADPSEAGRKGAQTQDRDAKVRGGENSRGNSNSNNV